MAENMQDGQPTNQGASQEHKIIDESNYQIKMPRQRGPVAVGKGGDPLYRRINAPRAELLNILEEASTMQDYIQRKTSNNVALACLNNENLKEVYFEIKDGFGEYGPIMLMGFKTPQGVEIPRLKILDKNGEVQEVLTGPLAIEEINRRALAYRGYDPTELPIEVVEAQEVIQDYSGNPSDYA